MLNRKSFKSICFIVILVLLPFVPNQQPKAGSGNGEVAVNTTDSQVTDIGGDVVRQKAFLGNMKLIAENDVLELYFDETETDVAVRTKETGDIWFSNPLEASSDTIASVYYQNQMKSQFSIQYYNENVQSSEMDNFNDSIKKEQFEVSYEDMGVTISYTLGELASVMVLPGAISEEHMLLYTAKMEEGSSKKVLRNYTLLSLAAMDKTEQEKQLKAYPVLSEKNIYILKSGAKDYVKEEISGYFQEAGYTQKDKEQDAADCCITEENTNPWFKIPLTYTLEG